MNFCVTQMPGRYWKVRGGQSTPESVPGLSAEEMSGYGHEQGW